jgi:hypothetical protein
MIAGSGFELVCSQDAWVGVGRYQKDGDRLRFSFTALTRQGVVVRDPQPVEFIFRGKGNELVLRRPESESEWTWHRILPGEDTEQNSGRETQKIGKA